jgi:quinol monooxygenase YgiN
VKAIEMFVRAVRENEPDTFYEAFRKESSLEFVHIMKFPNEEAEKQHTSAPYASEFVEILYPNCEEQPVFTNLTEIK